MGEKQISFSNSSNLAYLVYSSVLTNIFGGLFNNYMATILPDCFYRTSLLHIRYVDPQYRFMVKLFYLLCDIDALPALAQKLRWFSYNRFNVLSIRSRDCGDGKQGADPEHLRTWMTDKLAERGIDLAGGKIYLLTMPRLWGWAFNPLAVWYCHHADGSLRAIVAEVRNTFGEKHYYFLDQNALINPASIIDGFTYELEIVKEKVFHVSPFLPLSGEYRFMFAQPGHELKIILDEWGGTPRVLQLRAALVGQALPLSNASVWRLVGAFPFQMIWVVIAIHWQALKIWVRGGVFHKKPSPPASSVT